MRAFNLARKGKVTTTTTTAAASTRRSKNTPESSFMEANGRQKREGVQLIRSHDPCDVLVSENPYWFWRITPKMLLHLGSGNRM
jgi:hypothetical protein